MFDRTKWFAKWVKTLWAIDGHCMGKCTFSGHYGAHYERRRWWESVWRRRKRIISSTHWERSNVIEEEYDWECEWKIVVWSIKNNRFCLHTSVKHLKVAHVLFTNPLQPSPNVHKKQAAILFRLFALLSFFFLLSSAIRLSIHRFASIQCAVSKVAI